MTISDLKETWSDDPDYHRFIHQSFIYQVNLNRKLRKHRDYIDSHIFGMGERSFHWLWKILMDELPGFPKLLEIGVFKGQVISLWKLLRTDAKVFGITPLDGRGTGWTEDDYGAHIMNIHHDFELDPPTLFIGPSEDYEIYQQADMASPFDVIYIDGGHDRHHIDNDMDKYAPMVKIGGFLVIDDACCDMKMPFGFFQGIQSVTDSVLDYMEKNGDYWEFLFNVVHLRIYRRRQNEHVA